MKHLHLILIGLAICFFTLSSVNGQVYTNKEVGKKNEVHVDSIKHSVWPYSLPILGKKTTAKGFNLPLPAGLNVQTFWQQSDIIIENLKVGFNEGEMYNLDEIVRFDKAVATAGAITLRPDIWLFPFLDIYGIFGYSKASTDVGFGVWIPDSTNTPKEILSAESKVVFNAPTMGFGMTPTFGVAGLFIALDMNMSWTDAPQLEKPTRAFIFGPRVGKSFQFKKKDMNLAIWAGGFRVNMNSGTSGSINLSDVLPVEDFGAKIDEGYQKLDDAQQQVNSWWEGLPPQEQLKPSNIARYEAANTAISKAGEVMVAVESAFNGVASSTVQYSMDKRPADKWNFIVGTQYQINKHFMIRAEGGFLGSRTQVTAGLQYRFGL